MSKPQAEPGDQKKAQAEKDDSAKEATVAVETPEPEDTESESAAGEDEAGSKGETAAGDSEKRDKEQGTATEKQPDAGEAQSKPAPESGKKVQEAAETAGAPKEKKESRRAELPDINPGDTLKVHLKVVEGGRERTQVFQGVVLKRQGNQLHETFTVRKISFGVGVERIFPLHSPRIKRVEVMKRGRVRRAKLYYLRERVGKKARIKEKR